MQMRTAVVLFAVLGDAAPQHDLTRRATLDDLLITGLTAAAPLGESEYTSLWSTFKADFTKAYTSVEVPRFCLKCLVFRPKLTDAPSSQEHAERFSVFKDNVDFIM